MVDLSHLRNNRKVVTATLAGVAVVAISVGVGVGLTRGPGESPVDDSVPTGQADTEPLGDKESFLRVDAPLEEVPEGADIVDGEKSKRVGVNYNRDWGSGGDDAWGGGGGSPVRCPDGSIAAKAGKANAGAVTAAGKSGKSGQFGRRCKYFSLCILHMSLFYKFTRHSLIIRSLPYSESIQYAP